MELRGSRNYWEPTQKKIERATFSVYALGWLRGLDLNQRPPGYEPDELPGCSTPRSHDSGCAQRRQTLPPAAIILFQLSATEKSEEDQSARNLPGTIRRAGKRRKPVRGGIHIT